MTQIHSANLSDINKVLQTAVSEFLVDTPDTENIKRVYGYLLHAIDSMCTRARLTFQIEKYETGKYEVYLYPIDKRNDTISCGEYDTLNYALAACVDYLNKLPLYNTE